MNRWDWIRGIIGMSRTSGAARDMSASMLANLQESFESIANVCERFEAEIKMRLEQMHNDFAGMLIAMQQRVEKSELRISRLEEILFEPDPQVRKEKIEALRPVPSPATVSQFPIDRSKS